MYWWANWPVALSHKLVHCTCAHGNLTTGSKTLWKRWEHFSSFYNIFTIFLSSGVKLDIHLWNVVVRFIVFLKFANLICPGTDISKCFRKSLGFRDNESRLHLGIAVRKSCIPRGMFWPLHFKFIWVQSLCNWSQKILQSNWNKVFKTPVQVKLV